MAYTCDNQSWAAADNPRSQMLDAQVSDSGPITIRNNETITAGVKASGFKAEAWSAWPSEGAGWASIYNMRSNASARVTGGCLMFEFEACTVLESPDPRIRCRIGETRQAWYATSDAASCLGFAQLPVQ